MIFLITIQFFRHHSLSLSSVLQIIGVNFFSVLSRKNHIMSLARRILKKLGMLYRFWDYFTTRQLLWLHKRFFDLYIEYSSFHSFLPLLLCCNVVSLSIIYKYSIRNYSFELSQCMLPLLKRASNTYWATHFYSFSVQILNASALHVCSQRINYESLCLHTCSSFLLFILLEI